MSVPVLIVNYGMGNLRSVVNAFSVLECTATISDDPRDAAAAESFVLPGVGAFGDGMENLRSAGWIEALDCEVRKNRKPILGLCLGMQLLATKGTEHGVHQGLNWIPGIVEKLPPGEANLRIPHIGWNDVKVTKSDGLYAGLTVSPTFYFVHSYVLRPNDPEIVSGVCEYGGEFAASVEMGNIYATQFHPEKSQGAGLQVLRRFVEIVKAGQC
jgi:glutamine amidotransferase